MDLNFLMNIKLMGIISLFVRASFNYIKVVTVVVKIEKVIKNFKLSPHSPKS